MTNLKPCPFCGSRARLIRENGEYWIKCERPGVCFGCVHARIGRKSFMDEYGDAGFAHKDDAIRLWNTRDNAEEEK